MLPPAARVAVTGARGGLGLVVAERLAGHAVAVVGIGSPAPPGAQAGAGDLPGITWRDVDVRDAHALAPALAGVDAVVHLALALAPDDDPAAREDLHRRGTAAVVQACAAAGVAHLVAVTSAAVFGATPETPVPLDEDSPLAPRADGTVGDLVLVERELTAGREAHPALRVTVLRPAAMVGGGLDSVTARHFSSPRLMEVAGTAMRWQFAHVDDVAAAVERVLRGDVPPGVLTVGCDGWLSMRDAEQITGLRTVTLPAALAFGAAERLHRAGLTPTPAAELAYLVYPWVVTSERLHAAGWRPAYDNATALGALLADVAGSTAVAGRVIVRRDATLAGAGVASATVAALGAAAIVRRARRLRGR